MLMGRGMKKLPIICLHYTALPLSREDLGRGRRFIGWGALWAFAYPQMDE